jgi:hypothetical protein
MRKRENWENVHEIQARHNCCIRPVTDSAGGLLNSRPTLLSGVWLCSRMWNCSSNYNLVIAGWQSMLCCWWRQHWGEWLTINWLIEPTQAKRDLNRPTTFSQFGQGTRYHLLKT